MVASRSAKEWRWGGESRKADRFAQVFGETLERIQQEKGGQYEARDVVEAARSKRSPIHAMFEWQDDVAAEKYRETQARDYIRALVVILPVGNDRVVAPAAVSFGSGEGYNDTESVMLDATLRQRLVNSALKEAEAWMDRYKHLDELATVFGAVKKTRERLRVGDQRTAPAGAARQVLAGQA